MGATPAEDSSVCGGEKLLVPAARCDAATEEPVCAHTIHPLPASSMPAAGPAFALLVKPVGPTRVPEGANAPPAGRTDARIVVVVATLRHAATAPPAASTATAGEFGVLPPEMIVLGPEKAVPPGSRVA